MAVRTTDQRTAGHRLLVNRSIITALRNVFNDTYNRDRELIDLKVTNTYPLLKVDYPCIVVEYEPQRIVQAGVGHTEWFNDSSGNLRRWGHRRFEGALNFSIFALSPLDRDLVADALVELLSFGRLDPQLNTFFIDVYGDPSNNNPPVLIFNQLMLDTDQIEASGNSVSLAPWNPEDQLVYETGHSITCHGAYYNVQPDETWQIITNVDTQAYPQFQVDEQFAVTFPQDLPFNDPTINWTNPFVYTDAGLVTGSGAISAVIPTNYTDSGLVTGIGVVSAVLVPSGLAPSQTLAPSLLLAPST